MIRKVGAVLLILISAIGLILCLVLIIGAWLANEPATIAVTDSLDAVDGYLGLASQTTEQTEAQLTTVQSLVDRIASVNPEQVAAVREELEQQIIPIITQVQSTLVALHNSLVALNHSLEQLNTLPGVSAPTLGDGIEGVDAQLIEINQGVNDLTVALSSSDLDGERITTAAATISGELSTARGAVDSWTGNIEGMRAATASAKHATPSIFDLTSTTISLLFLLMGAGQWALFMVGLRLFRSERV